jgi:SWI/SNF-related matrix-associated actin-dependent regulator of chromatin subfamily A member 5
VRRSSPFLIDDTNVYKRTEDFDLLASEIQDKTADEVKEYYAVFKKKWKTLSGELPACRFRSNLH